MKREVREHNQGSCEDDPIVKAEKARKFPYVYDNFKVIASNTITVVVDEDLRLRLEDRENRKNINPREIQLKTVNIYSSKSMSFGVAPIDGFRDLYCWTLKYDDFLGYMAGVLTITNFSDNCCI
jgi:CRISPR-associated endonuclease/helicase Cas3